MTQIRTKKMRRGRKTTNNTKEKSECRFQGQKMEIQAMTQNMYQDGY